MMGLVKVEGEAMVVPLDALPSILLEDWPLPTATTNMAKVHWQLARYNSSGTLPGQDGVMDLPSALFHLAHAAIGAEKDAVRCLRLMCDGIPQDIMPGMSLQEPH